MGEKFFFLFTLPKGQKDDRFNDGELEDRIVRCQQIFSGEIKEEERVESQRDGNIVDNCDVEIARVGTE